MGTPLSSINPALRLKIEAVTSTMQLKSLPVRLAAKGTHIIIGPTSAATFIVPIEPMGKPRMTRRDKWAKRECVVRYREFSDELRAKCAGINPNPLSVSWRAFFTMPQSWSKKKRAEYAGEHHRAKPDRDNIDKAILDSLWEQDSGIARGSLEKFWDDGKGARLEITVE